MLLIVTALIVRIALISDLTRITGFSIWITLTCLIIFGIMITIRASYSIYKTCSILIASKTFRALLMISWYALQLICIKLTTRIWSKKWILY